MSLLMKIIFSLFFFVSSGYTANSSIVLKNADSLLAFSKDTVVAGGNVKIQHKKTFMNGDLLKYVKSNSFLEISGNVSVYRNDGENFFADTMTYFRNTSVFKASSNIRGEFEKEKIFLQSDSIYYDLRNKFGWIWHNPRIYILKKKDTINIFGDSLFLNKKNHKIISIGNARICSESFNVFGDSLTYYTKQDSFIVSGKNPLVTTRQDSIKGDLIVSKLERDNNKILYVNIYNNVLIINSKDSINQYSIFADRVFSTFKGKRNYIDNVSFWKTPKAKFYQVRQKKYIDISSDSITVTFEDSNKIDVVKEFNESKLFSYKINEKKDYFLGDTIYTYFSDNKIDTLKAFRHAVAGYNIKNNKKKAFNEVSGDSVEIKFFNSKPSIIDVFGRVEGNLINQR